MSRILTVACIAALVAAGAGAAGEPACRRSRQQLQGVAFDVA
jgi:hypothetical protein